MPKKLEEIKEKILKDKNFKPKKGKTKEQSAYAIATAKFKKIKKKRG